MSDMDKVGNVRISLLYTSRQCSTVVQSIRLFVFHICDNRIEGIIHPKINVFTQSRPNLNFLTWKTKREFLKNILVTLFIIKVNDDLKASNTPRPYDLCTIFQVL